MTALTTEPRATEGTDLLVLTLDVSDDDKTWHRVAFEGENPAYVDRQAAAWVAERRYLLVQMDEGGERWSLFPRTFDAAFRGVVRRRQLVQAQAF